MSSAPSEISQQLQQRLAKLSPAQRAVLERKLGINSAANASAEGIPRYADGALAPLTPAQEVLWTLQRAMPEVFAYNVPRLLEVKGDLDTEAMRAALSAIVHRHEILRTHFITTTDGPRQQIAEESAFDFEVVDLRVPFAEIGDVARDLALASHIAERVRRPFNLEIGPQLRATLLHVAPDDWRVLLVLHHITSDESSRDILFRELSALYAAARQGTLDATLASLPALPIRYADFARWQSEQSARGSLREQIDYWRDRLSGLTTLELPTDRPRTSTPSFSGARYRVTFPAAIHAGVHALARKNDVTPFMILLAAMNVVLYRYTGQRDIAFGAPVSGRSRAEVENVLGYFPTQVVLRTDVDPALSFSELVQRVRATCFGAFDRQDVPLEQLMNELTDRVDSQQPLFRVCVQMAGGAAFAPALGDSAVRVLPTDAGAAKFDLVAGFEDGADALRMLLEYRTDLFDAETIARLGQHLETLLLAAIANPAVTVKHIVLLASASAERALLTGANNTELAFPHVPLHAIVRDVAKRFATAPAIVADDATLSYTALHQRSSTIKAALIALGVGPEARVAICMDRHSDLVPTMLAVLRCGAAYVPLDPAYPAERIAHVLSDAQASVVVVDAAASVHDSAGAQVLQLSELPAYRAEFDTPDADVDPESLAYILYTSGSTGKPKGVMIPHRGLVNFLVSMQQRPGLTARDAIVAVTTVSFDISGLELWLPLISGAKVVLASRETAVDGIALRALIERTTGQHRDANVMVQATPATWHLLIEAGWNGASNVVILCGGEAWPAGLSAQLRARSDAVWNVYGPTETTIWSTRAHVTSDEIVLGEPLGNTTLFVLDANEELSPIGIPGELWIGGAGVARGYHGRPDLTAERFVEHAQFGRLYRTGDLVRRTADGRLTYLRRQDDQVKVRGYRIELGEIEAVIASMPEVVQVAASLQRVTPDTDPRIVCHVVLSDAGKAQEPMHLTGIIDGLRKVLPDYMVPSGIMRMDQLPLTPNGKLDRRALPLIETPAAVARAYVAPRSSLEVQIANVWQDVLRVERVGVDDDFFELGGHSLLAMRVLARLSEILDVRMTLGNLFESRTVAAFAALAMQRLAPTDASLAGDANASARQPTHVPITRRLNAHEAAPLSRAQELLWVYEQINPGTSAYNVPMARRMSGLIDVPALHRALEALIARHEALRTSISEAEGEPRQSVASTSRATIEEHDLRAIPVAERDERCTGVVRELASRPFVLTESAGPRVALIHVNDEQAVLMFVMHHIVCDGTSLAILFDEFSLLLAAEYAGETASLAEIALHPADFAVWERDSDDASSVSDAIKFWREYLDGAPTEVDLPADFVRNAQDAALAVRLVHKFPLAFLEQMRALARAQGVTLFNVLLTGLHTLLHRYSNQDDIVVGAVVSGRTRPETQRMVGHFAETLPLRSKFDDDPTFADLLQRHRNGVVQAFSTLDVGFSRILQELRSHSVEGAGKFNVAFVLQDAAAARNTGADVATKRVQLAPYESELDASKFDITFSMTELGDGLRVAAHFRGDLFQRETIERMLQHWQRLLSAAAETPATRTSVLTMLTPDELHQQLVLFNDSDAEWQKSATLHGLFEEQVLLRGNAIAVEDGTSTLSYTELNERANRLAWVLRNKGVGPDSLVAVCMEKSANVIVTLLGILKAGGAYVPIDPAYPDDRIAFTLQDSNVSFVVADTQTADRLQGSSAELVLAPDVWLHATNDGHETRSDNPSPLAGAQNLCYVIYTSGSTGRPKGVLIEHQNVVRLMKNSRFQFEFNEHDVWTVFHSFSFDFSVWEMYGALLYGGRTIVITKDIAQDPARYLALIRDRGVTVLNQVPSAFYALMHEALADAPVPLDLRYVIFGGEALQPALLREFKARYPAAKLINMFGITETTVHVTYKTIDDPEIANGSSNIGGPIPTLSLYVLDEQLQPVPIGVTGELCVAGAGVARGYLNRPTLTAERFVPNPFRPGERLYRSGDLGRIRSRGEVEYLGRRDEQVKIRGFRIELGEIGSVLGAHPDVTACFTMVRSTNIGDPRIVAYYVPREAPLSNETLRAWAAQRLPEFMIPTAFVPLAALPITGNGKVNRAQLPEPELAGSSAQFIEPRNDVEEVVAGLWREILKLDRVGVEASFFEVGGHSLLATRITGRVSKIFRVTFPLRQFFESPTIAGIARALAQLEAKPGQADLIARLYKKAQQMTPEQRESLRREAAATRQAQDL